MENDQDFTNEESNTNSSKSDAAAPYMKWVQLGFFAILLLLGQSSSTLLGRLYFEKGGNSKWMQTLVQILGFPVLIPILYFTNRNTVNRLKSSSPSPPPSPKPPFLALILVYSVLGILLVAGSMLSSLGMAYLPVTTFTLVSATQLGFNTIMSFFINSQKFTPFIINSVVLLTISSALLMFQSSDSDSEIENYSKSKHTTGIVCTLASAALYSLSLSLTELAFTKVIRRNDVKVLVEFIIWVSLVATLLIMICLFGSGEWKTMKQEMNLYELGKVSYFLTLIWTAICCQIFTIGFFGLLVKASPLFANVISTLCLPVVTILAIIIFKDKMNGVIIVQ